MALSLTSYGVDRSTSRLARLPRWPCYERRPAFTEWRIGGVNGASAFVSLLTVRLGSETLFFVKEAVFHRAVREVIRSFPDPIKKAFGKAIRELQSGVVLDAPLSKPMKTVSSGAFELRFKDGSGAYRAFYFLKLKNKILIFHIFKKKTQKTPTKEINLGKKRLKELLDEQA